jgi:hypothetical protein
MQTHVIYICQQILPLNVQYDHFGAPKELPSWSQCPSMKVQVKSNVETCPQQEKSSVSTYPYRYEHTGTALQLDLASACRPRSESERERLEALLRQVQPDCSVKFCPRTRFGMEFAKLTVGDMSVFVEVSALESQFAGVEPEPTVVKRPKLGRWD